MQLAKGRKFLYWLLTTGTIPKRPISRDEIKKLEEESRIRVLCERAGSKVVAFPCVQGGAQ
jgi:hypothetical protein